MDTPDISTLSGDDAMAFGFFSMAAAAIRDIPSLRRELSTLNDSFADLRTAHDTLADIRRTQDETIATLRAQVENLREAEAQRTAELLEARDEVAARQHDIDLLDATVMDLRDIVEGQDRAHADLNAKSQLQAEALDKVINTLNAVNRALGRPDLDPDPREEIEAATRRPSVEWDHSSTVPETQRQGSYSEEFSDEFHKGDHTGSDPFESTTEGWALPS